MLLSSLLAFPFFVAPTTAPVQASTIFVDENATGPVHDGSTWCTAFTTLYEGLAASSAGDSILVAGGLYTPDPAFLTNPRLATFQLIDGVNIVGAYAGCGAPDPFARDFANDTCIIRGDPLRNDETTGDQSDNSYHIMTADGLSTPTLLDGLYLDAGVADSLAIADGNIGAGLLVRGSSGLTLNDCIFQDDKAWTGPDSQQGKGGAVYLRQSKVTFIHTLFRESIGGESAGGVYCQASSAVFDDCTFAACLSSITGGGIYNGKGSRSVLRDCTFIVCGSQAFPNLGRGGAIYNNNGDCQLVRCDFRGSNAGVDGGALYNRSASMDAVNCMFTFSSAGNDGGVLYNTDSGVRLSNCLLVRGNAQNQGGGIFSDSSKMIVSNCTLTEQTAGTGTAGIRLVGSGGGAAISNCILWTNTVQGVAGEFEQVSSTSTTTLLLNYTDVQGLTGLLGGTGNLGTDPLFVDPALSDYHLSAGSPCLDTGDNNRIQSDFGDLDGNGNTLEKTPLDLDLTKRIHNGTVDMGAYERP